MPWSILDVQRWRPDRLIPLIGIAILFLLGVRPASAQVRSSVDRIEPLFDIDSAFNAMDLADHYITVIRDDLGVPDSMHAAASRHLRLPRIAFVVERCGPKDMPYYDPSRAAVILCAEFVRDLTEYSSGTGDLRHFYANGLARFVYAHELGHALIDHYSLAVVGEEEIAADEFAMWLLTTDNQIWAVWSGARYFRDVAYREEWTVSRATSAHGLNIQRLARAHCWLWANGAAYSKLEFLQEHLHVEDFDGCRQSVTRSQQSWDRLLAPYRRSTTRR